MLKITQTLNFRYAQYMGNHRKIIFWPLKFPNPNCTLCRCQDRDTWPYVLSTCEHPYLKGLIIACHNQAVHLITQALQANKHTRFYTLINAWNLNNKNQKNMLTHYLLMSSQIKTRHLEYPRSPNSHINTYTTFPHPYDTTHRVHILPWHISQTSPHTQTCQIRPIDWNHTRPRMENQPPNNHHSMCKRSYTLA